jgi:hypothetical protein
MTKSTHTDPKRNLSTGRWTKGASGNPAGRPPGSRNRSTMLAEELFQGDAEALIRKAVELGLQGDTAALRLCLERICPPRKERLVELSEITGSEPASGCLGQIVTAVAQGRLTPGEGESLARILETQVRVGDVEELAQRVTALEAAPKVEG